MRLRSKLLVVLLPVVLAGLMLQWVVSSVTQDRQMTAQRTALLAHLLEHAALRLVDERHGVLATYGLEEEAVYVQRYQASALADLAALAERTDVLIAVLDAEGQPLQPADLTLSDAAVLARRAGSGLAAFVETIDGAVHLVAARKAPAWGWTVIAAYPLAAVKQAIRSVNVAVTSALLLTGVCMTLSLFVGIDRLVIWPIKELGRNMRALAAGRQPVNLRLDGSDEVSALAREMDAMAASIATYTAELERSNGELDMFAAAVSHDLRAPLRAINTIAGWLESDAAPLSDAALAHLDRLRDQVARMDAMLRGLLCYAQASQVSGPLSRCEVPALVDAQLDLLALEKTVTVTFAGEMPTLVTPEPPLALVLRNIIDNAIKHHDRTAVALTVSARRQGRRVVIGISDDGPGAAAGDRRQLFASYRPGRAGSAGIGLALVRRIVQRLGGNLSVECAPGERGTTVLFDWPLDCTLLPNAGGGPVVGARAAGEGALAGL